jgi:hypothetical protein
VSRKTILVIALTDPARLVSDPELWRKDPKELIDQPHPDVPGAVLAAHYNTILKVTQKLPTKLGDPPSSTQSDPSEGRELREVDKPHVRYRAADSEEEALQWAVGLLACAHKELSAAKAAGDEDRGPRLQCGMALVQRSPKTIADRLPWAAGAQTEAPTRGVRQPSYAAS